MSKSGNESINQWIVDIRAAALYLAPLPGKIEGLYFMRKLIGLFSIALIVTTCQDSILLIPDSGAISGIIFPGDQGSLVELHQEILISATSVANDGTFRIEDVVPGTYLLKIITPGYGRRELGGIKIGSGESVFLGDIRLLVYPWPMTGIKPDATSTNLIPGRTSVRVFFNEPISHATQSAVQVTPEPDNLAYLWSGSTTQLSLTGNFLIGTDYAVMLDTTLTTLFGDHLEFPWTHNFTTDSFAITKIRLPTASLTDLLIELNASVLGDSLLAHLTTTPDVPLLISIVNFRNDGSSSRFNLRTQNGWPPGVVTTLTVAGGLAAASGATLGQDSTFAVMVDTLRVTNIIPQNDQFFVNTNSTIRIRFNAFVEPSSLLAAISFLPPAAFSLEMSRSTQMTITPDTLLIADTLYTVIVDTTIRDMWGGTLGAPFKSTFWTE